MHRHAAEPAATGRRLAVTLVLVAAYMVAEVVGGLVSNSLALLADAGHMLSDVAALGLSLFALWIARRPPSPRHTFGFYRAEILAALVNGATLIAVSIFIFLEAFRRLREPPEVAGPLVTWVAFGGLVVNALGLWLLHADRSTSLNLRGAWLHLLADALGTLATIVAGVLIWAFSWYLADPVASAVIGLLVIHSSWELLRDSVTVLMEQAPAHLDTEELRRAMTSVPGVCEVHELHVWSIAPGRDALSGHIIVGDCDRPSDVLAAVRGVLHERFDIDHVTIQIEPPGFVERRQMP
jgi:cobalt-zinc-cadmium efflux system protein